MFGSEALRYKTRVFAMVVKGQLVAKVSAQHARELIDGKQGGAFDPGHGRIMKQWVAIGASAKLDRWSVVTMTEPSKALPTGTRNHAVVI